MSVLGAMMRTYSFRIRAVKDEYNGEYTIKHTVVAVQAPDWNDVCKKYTESLKLMESETTPQTDP